MRIRNPNLWKRARALLPPHHERHHTRQVGLQRKKLQVEHQLQMFFKHPRRSRRLLRERRLNVALRLSKCDTPLNISDGFGIFVEPRAITRSNRDLKIRQLVGHRVKNALFLMATLSSDRRVSRTTIPK